MTKLELFIATVEEGILPDVAPAREMEHYLDLSAMVSVYNARHRCNLMGMWAIVDKKWTKHLAKYIGTATCLEVMSGAGWLAKALHDHGVDIIATDDYSWQDKQHRDMKVVYDVERLGGLEAVKHYGQRDVLIVSWPPYDSDVICSICDEWGNNKPIIYIGEGSGGCCAGDEFWADFAELEKQPEIYIPVWDGVHDYLTIGKWNRVKVSKSAIRQLEVCES